MEKTTGTVPAIGRPAPSIKAAENFTSRGTDRVVPEFANGLSLMARLSSCCVFAVLYNTRMIVQAKTFPKGFMNVVVMKLPFWGEKQLLTLVLNDKELPTRYCDLRITI
jgi:hypothetical protein